METYRFSSVPGFHSTKVVIGACGELEVEIKSKEAVDTFHEIEKCLNLIL